jgi:hypothetical protein
VVLAKVVGDGRYLYSRVREAESRCQGYTRHHDEAREREEARM